MPADLALAGKVAIVTGSARGIGAEIVYELAKHGAQVMITYISSSSSASADALIARVESLQNGSAAAAIVADLRLPKSPDCIVKATLAAFSVTAIDILVNNAGAAVECSLTDITVDNYAHVFDVNVRGAMLMTKAVIPYLRAPARIINISSVAARRTFDNYSIYSASKAALEGFTRASAVELGPAGHSVNAVAPGQIRTDILDMIPKEIVEAQQQLTPMQHRTGTTDDVAPIVAWLARENSRWITGQTLSACGGLMML
ncbi:hypothetical protein HDZ31DRAFT_68280 [Schizophyllum fasciatum]